MLLNFVLLAVIVNKYRKYINRITSIIKIKIFSFFKNNEKNLFEVEEEYDFDNNDNDNNNSAYDGNNDKQKSITTTEIPNKWQVEFRSVVAELRSFKDCKLSKGMRLS